MELKTLEPLQLAIVDKGIENLTRKLIGGMQNKNNAPQKGDTNGLKSNIKNTIEASTSQSVMEVSNRGVQWKEMVQKSFSHGISSLKTLQFDGEFHIKDGISNDLKSVPSKPGVYVVYDNENKPVYVGDAEKLNKRWMAGHLNENKLKEERGEKYKLNQEFTEGCTVRYIICKSKETAAAIEANLIKNNRDILINKKEELLHKQGTRSNIEAKKMKDASGTIKTLAKGAAKEVGNQVAFQGLESVINVAIKAIKDELVDLFKGGESSIYSRIKRVLLKILDTIKTVFTDIKSILKALFKFITNAISETVRKVYNLAENIFDLGVASYNLYKGKKTMSSEELVTKISETIIVSGSIVLWDAADSVIETFLKASSSTILAPLAPYSSMIASIISAIGFGVTSHYLIKIVPKIINYVINFKSNHQKAREEVSNACKQIVKNSELNLVLMNDLKSYLISSAELATVLSTETMKLETERAKPIEDIDFLTDINNILNS